MSWLFHSFAFKLLRREREQKGEGWGGGCGGVVRGEGEGERREGNKIDGDWVAMAGVNTRRLKSQQHMYHRNGLAETSCMCYHTETEVAESILLSHPVMVY